METKVLTVPVKFAILHVCQTIANTINNFKKPINQKKSFFYNPYAIFFDNKVHTIQYNQIEIHYQVQIDLSIGDNISFKMDTLSILDNFSLSCSIDIKRGNCYILVGFNPRKVIENWKVLKDLVYVDN